MIRVLAEVVRSTKNAAVKIKFTGIINVNTLKRRVICGKCQREVPAEAVLEALPYRNR